MLVVDTNTVAYLYLDPQYLTLLRAVLERDQHWIAPSLWRSELRNVLLLYLRKNLISMDKAIDVMAAAEGLLGGTDYFPASAHVLSLALASGCSTYDCEYVALARDTGTYLITFDRKLLAAFPNVAITPTTYLTSTS
jgi:predicted nucleic acid-binding protein